MSHLTKLYSKTTALLTLSLILLYTGGYTQCTSGYTSGDLTVSGSCTISSDITITGNLILSTGASLIVDPGVTVSVTGDFETQYGTHTVSGGGAIDVTGRFYNNVFDQSLTISNMTITVGNNGGSLESKNEYSSTLNLQNGTLFTITDGNFVNENDTDLTIDNASLVISSGNYTNDSGATTTVQNGGSLIVSDGNLTTEGGSHLTVDNSTVNISGDFNNSFQAQLDVVNNSTFIIGGTFDNGYDADGNSVNEGYVNVNGSDINVGGDFNNAFGSNMDIDGGGTVTVDNDLHNFFGGTIDVPDGALVVGGTITDDNNGISATCTDGCCGDGCGALPVILAEMTYHVSDDHIVLTWKTASELNNDYFTIEKSFDGQSFTIAGYVQGSGTTTTLQTYQWRDSSVLRTQSYYRLKQTDFDGSSEYHGILQVETTVQNVKVFPNPVTSGSLLKVYGSGVEEKEWVIKDVQGNVIKQGTFSNQLSTINTVNLESGFYFLTIGSQKQAYRIIIK